jgi:GTP-binding protein YchF
MKLGIIGLPMSGKRTLFKALTKTETESKMENRQAMVRVPDTRIDTLSEMYNPKKTTYAQIDYFLPGLAFSKDEKTKDQPVWGRVRDCDALIHVLRNFEETGLGHPDPVEDFRKLDEELMLSDLVVVDKRLERLDADLKKRRTINQTEYTLLQECRTVLEGGIPLRRNLPLASSPVLRGFTFLSAKPVLATLNGSEAGDDIPEKFENRSGERFLSIRGKIEHEIARMSDEEGLDFLSEFGIAEPAMNKAIRESYSLLGLISFFTVGEDEVRAWTIRAGTRAVDAAEEIHSDIKKGFIRAEVVSYDDLVESGSYVEAKKRGLVRLEGKEYVVEDGDVMEFRFSV